jgi:processive 1,2-diacylglycerol beta-glucosyltransferase
MRPRCLLHPEIPTLNHGLGNRGQRDDSTIAVRGQTSHEDALSLKQPAHADVQIWAVGTGGGHLSVAQALARALVSRGESKVTVALDDPTQDQIGRTSRAMARAYGPLVRTSPALWGLVFRGFSHPTLSSRLDRFLLRQLVPAMALRTRLRSPRVVINCHPLLGPAASRAASGTLAGATPALVTVMTDLVGGHEGWLAPRPDAMLTATTEATQWCLDRGVPAHLIRETGLPIDPDLGSNSAGTDRKALRRRLGLDPDLLCVLVGGGAEGVGSLRRWARWIGASGLPLQVVVACGHNRRVLNWLRRQPPSATISALDFQTSLTPWFQAADVYLGKPGPSTLAEAAAAGLAILVCQALPGQEELNGPALISAGGGRGVQRRLDLLRTLSRLCRPDDPLLAELQRGALAWARPDAASRAADVVLSFLMRSEGLAASPPQARSAAG